jgi:hypothetical protein
MTLQGCLFLTFLSGVHLAEKHRMLSSADPNGPSENNGARADREVQVFTVWAYAAMLSRAFALVQH